MQVCSSLSALFPVRNRDNILHPVLSCASTSCLLRGRRRGMDPGTWIGLTCVMIVVLMTLCLLTISAYKSMKCGDAVRSMLQTLLRPCSPRDPEPEAGMYIQPTLQAPLVSSSSFLHDGGGGYTVYRPQQDGYTRSQLFLPPTYRAGNLDTRCNLSEDWPL